MKKIIPILALALTVSATAQIPPISEHMLAVPPYSAATNFPPSATPLYLFGSPGETNGVSPSVGYTKQGVCIQDNGAEVVNYSFDKVIQFASPPTNAITVGSNAAVLAVLHWERVTNWQYASLGYSYPDGHSENPQMGHVESNLVAEVVFQNRTNRFVGSDVILIDTIWRVKCFRYNGSASPIVTYKNEMTPVK